MDSIQSYVTRFLLKRSNIWNRPLCEIRKSMESIKAKGIPDGVSVRDDEINGVACKVFLCNEEKKDKAVLYFHGGGFCLGIYPSNFEFVAGISKLTGINTYMPDYRLAPENPFPTALEDAVAAYKGVLEKGYNADDLIVMGDSSGSSLAVSALLVLKQSGVRMPKALVFITPVFDFAGKGETFITRAEKDVFCKYFLYKVASNFCILLQVQNVQSCKFCLQTLVSEKTPLISPHLFHDPLDNEPLMACS